MKSLVIPDVHLDIENLKKILQSQEAQDCDRLVFLGDFFDNFGDSPKRNAEMAQFLKNEILYNEKATILVGNHDLHYHPKCLPQWRCSGYSHEKREAIEKVLSLEDFNQFDWATTIDDVLLTHGGLHPSMIPWGQGIDAQSLCQYLNKKCLEALETQLGSEPLLQAGRLRYGPQAHGGIIWMDVREYEHIEGIKQIFGHTPLKNPIFLGPENERSLCLDCQLSQALVINDNQSWELKHISDLKKSSSFEKNREGKIKKTKTNKKFYDGKNKICPSPKNPS